MAVNYLLYESENFLLLDKPHNMPTVPLKSQGLEGTLLEQAVKLYPEILQVRGKNPWEGGALHRLDTATSGIVLFAKTQSFYDRMQELQENNLFEKYYLATTCTNDSLKGLDIEKKDGIITISSYFRPFGPRAREVRATLDEKKASPKIIYKTAVLRNENKFCCAITKGFRHQIRAHLAWVGHPIIGDSLYGGDSLGGDSLYGAFEAGGTRQAGQGVAELQLECVGVSFGQSSFLKAKATSLSFPSLLFSNCNFANNSENVIILA